MNKKTILEQLKPDNIPVEKQVKLLGRFLMENFGNRMGENSGEGGEGAIEMAIRLLDNYKKSPPQALNEPEKQQIFVTDIVVIDKINEIIRALKNLN